jgi:hypothetical protein
LEEFESRGARTHPVDYVGGLLWVLLVERHRYEPYDAFEVVEGDWQERLRGIVSALVALRSPIREVVSRGQMRSGIVGRVCSLARDRPYIQARITSADCPISMSSPSQGNRILLAVEPSPDR